MGVALNAVSMNKRSTLLIVVFAIAALIARADLNIDAVVTEAKVDLEKAPAIVAKAAVDNPDSAVQIVTASVSAIPQKVIEIVCAVCKGLPKLSPEVVRAVLDVFPDRSSEIVAGVIDCVPADVRPALAAPVAPPPPPPQPNPPIIVSPSN